MSMAWSLTYPRIMGVTGRNVRRWFESGTTTSVSAAGTTTGTTSTNPLSTEVHHIVPGKCLPNADARLDLDLVTVCGNCHNHFEGAHAERRFAETDRNEALRVPRALKQSEQTLYALESMNCLRTRENIWYRAACPGVAWSAVEKLRSELERERVQRRWLVGMLEELGIGDG